MTTFDLQATIRLIAIHHGRRSLAGLADLADVLAHATAEALAQRDAAAATVRILRRLDAATAITAGGEPAAIVAAYRLPDTTPLEHELQETLDAQIADYERLEAAMTRIAGFAAGLHCPDRAAGGCIPACLGCALETLIPAHLVATNVLDARPTIGDQP